AIAASIHGRSSSWPMMIPRMYRNGELRSYFAYLPASPPGAGAASCPMSPSYEPVRWEDDPIQLAHADRADQLGAGPAGRRCRVAQAVTGRGTHPRHGPRRDALG